MIPPALLERAVAKGTDAEYQAYIRLFPSVLTYRYGEWLHGEGRCEVSHWRAVSNGAGVGVKPPYSAVPLTHEEHHYTHQKGSSYFNPHEWWEKMQIKMLQMWVNDVKPPTLEQYNARKECNIVMGSADHIMAFKLCLEDYFKNPNNPNLVMSIWEEKTTRSKKQNRALWGVIYPQLVKFYNSNPGAFIWDMVRSIWKGWDIDKDTVHAMCKRLFNENKSTTRMSKLRFTKYIDDIMAHFIKKHGKEIEPPKSPDVFDIYFYDE